MLEPRRIETNVEPKVIEQLGNNTYYYNYDIKSDIVSVSEIGDETRWNFIQVYLRGIPDYERCLNAIIREYVDVDEELALVNKYNAYQMGNSENAYVCEQYDEYITKVQEIKAKVRADFNKSPEVKENKLIPRQADAVKLLQMLIPSFELTDEQSLEVKAFYPDWNDCIGGALQVGDKVVYKNALYKVKQNISIVLETQAPGIATAALYEEIVEKQSGTKDDPITYPSDGNMTIYKDKYYKEDGIIYKCIRDSGQPLYAKLASLVGNYVELAN